jgi:hypothetical protein
VTDTPDPGEVYVTDSEARQMCGSVSAMTFWRWDRNPDLGFPKPIKINGRKYRNKGVLLNWWARRTAE